MKVAWQVEGRGQALKGQVPAKVDQYLKTLEDVANGDLTHLDTHAEIARQISIPRGLSEKSPELAERAEAIRDAMIKQWSTRRFKTTG